MRTPSNKKKAVSFPQLVEAVERHGLTVSWEKMAPGFAGAVDLRSGVIFLDRTLDARPRHGLSVLAHELGHVALLHGCVQDPHGERLADEWAARFLIGADEFASAERAYGENTYALAMELGVTTKIIEAYKRTLAMSVVYQWGSSR